MIFTTIHIERPEGTTIASAIPAQHELVSMSPLDDEGHDRPYQAYAVYVEWQPTLSVPYFIRRRDVLQDEKTIDPLTGTNLRMRVTNVEVFEQDHLELLCQQIIGN